MVMLSDPADIRALYTERAHGLPPGRTFALRPILGARSLLLLEGAEHLARRKRDAAAVPRRAHARVRADGARRRRARDRDVAGGRAVPGPPADAGGHARGDPARGVRRATTAPDAGATRLHGLLRADRVAAAAVRRAARAAARRRAGRSRRIERESARARRAAARRRSPTARARATGDDILSPAQGRALRGRRADERPRDPRPARHAAARRPRDHGDRPRLDLRPAAAPPGACTRRLVEEVDAGDDAYLRAVGQRGAAPAPGRAARRPPPGGAARDRRPVAAGGHRRHARDLAHPHQPGRSTRTRTRSAPSASSTASRTPTRGSRSAAACAAASAPPSPSSRCASCSTAVLRAPRAARR